MAPRQVHDASLRPDQPETSRLLWALALSLAIHLMGLGGYQLGRELNLWRAVPLPSWLEHALPSLAATNTPAARDRDVPLVFVDVNPQVATAEPPRDAKFYSNLNSQAANPEIDSESDVPKISGEQTEIVKAEDVERAPMDRLQPNFPRAEVEQPAELPKPTTPEAPGDLAMAKPELELRESPGTSERARPRTIAEALRLQNRNQLAGQRMRQEGGVNRRVEFTALDAKATPFGDYDAAFIAAVESRWFNLLDNISYDGYRRGRVVLRFHLTHDGRITDLEIVENTVGPTLGLLCEKAIRDPAPFQRWPREMRMMMDKDYRDIQFAFHYN